MTYRRLKGPRLPDVLRETGWQLHHGPDGWQCTHLSGTTTGWHSVAGQAIEAAWQWSEPDHEVINKWSRERLYMQIIVKVGLSCLKK